MLEDTVKRGGDFIHGSLKNRGGDRGRRGGRQGVRGKRGEGQRMMNIGSGGGMKNSLILGRQDRGRRWGLGGGEVDNCMWSWGGGVERRVGGMIRRGGVWRAGGDRGCARRGPGGGARLRAGGGVEGVLGLTESKRAGRRKRGIDDNAVKELPVLEKKVLFREITVGITVER